MWFSSSASRAVACECAISRCHTVKRQAHTKASWECSEAKELRVGSVGIQRSNLAQKVRGYSAHAAHQTQEKVADQRDRDLADSGLVPNWLERVELLGTGFTVSTYPLSAMRYSKGSGRATYLAPTQESACASHGRSREPYQWADLRQDAFLG